jgi:hypothetical protein
MVAREASRLLSEQREVLRSRFRHCPTLGPGNRAQSTRLIRHSPGAMIWIVGGRASRLNLRIRCISYNAIMKAREVNSPP